MSKTTLVALITGFLGSGKTTFLNRVIESFPKELKLTILMNEFGEIGVDGTLVEGDDIDMMEISRGSIFCVCVKTDFIKGLYELNSKVKPDLLIIESTGVANPSDLKRDLQLPIFDNRFEFTEQFCIIDSAHFLDSFEVFASVEKQLSTSTVFIINKTDLVAADTISQIKNVVRENHPEPRFFETTYSEIPLGSFPFLHAGGNGEQDSGSQGGAAVLFSEKDLDDFIATMLDDPELQTTPPDNLASVTYTWHGDNLNELREMALKLPPAIIRAKGFVNGSVRENNDVSLFSYVMGDWTIEPTNKQADEIAGVNMVVFIGEPESINGIGQYLSSPNWSAREVLQPFGLIGKI